MLPQPGKRQSTFPVISKELSAFLVGILREKSFAEHPLTTQQIRQELQHISFQLTGGECQINTSLPTIRKCLNHLALFSSEHPAYFAGIYGGNIHKYHLNQEKSTRNHPVFIETDDYENEQKADNIKSFFAFVSHFTSNELFIMQSSIETNPYFSEKDTRTLIQKIYTAAPNLSFETNTKQLLFNEMSPMHLDSDLARLTENLKQLLFFLHHENQIEIAYGKYMFDRQSKKIQLVPRQLTPAKTPKFQRLDPIALLQANGFFYLIAHTDHSKTPDDVISYRIDRILSIRVFRDSLSHKELFLEKELLSYRNSFSALDYIKQHPVMYAGEKVTIKMLVLETKTFSPINAMLDTFGQQIFVRDISEQEAATYLKCSTKTLSEQGEHWYFVRLHHSVAGTLLWAKQHIESVLILSPKEAVDAIVSSVSKGLSRYQT